MNGTSMSDEVIDRKIAVIFVADVVGYSKHMEKDEDATLKAYSECERILKSLLDNRHGSIFNTAGDSVLVEFPSAVNAVECAVEFQNKIKERNQSKKTSTKLEYRIGINMGDVVSREGNLLGDGVNIAARLEALCQPNSVCISKSVYDLVVPKTKITFNDLGVQKIKQNIFHAYDILIDPSQKRNLKAKAFFQPSILIGAVALVAIVISILAVSRMLEETSGLPITEFEDTSKPIILVAPIKASGLTDDQQGFARGITESMIGTFSSYKGLTVLSSGTSFHTVETNMTNEAIRDQYNVKFMVRGSMQVMGQNARLNLEITDLTLSEVVETVQKDFNLSDIFKIQDELSKKLLASLQMDLGVGVSTWANRFDDMQDFTQSLNWQREWRKYTLEGYKASRAILDDLKNKYPDNHAPLLVLEAWQISQKLRFKIGSDEAGDLVTLRSILDKVTSENPDFSEGFNARALIGLLNLGVSCEDAILDIEKAEKNGSDQGTLLIGSGVYNRCGKNEQAITRLKEVLKISPNDPNWFQTGYLATVIYEKTEGKNHQQIYDVIGNKINATDMDPRVLAIYSIFEFEKGNNEKSADYYKRAVENGFRKDRLDFKNKPSLTVETHEKLDQIKLLILN